MKNLTKLGVASALISVSLLFCACGDNNEFKPSSEAEKKALALLKEKYPNYKKVLTYEFIAENFFMNKISGETLKQCVNNEKQVVLFATQSQSNNKVEMISIAWYFTYDILKGDMEKAPIAGSLLVKYEDCLKPQTK